MQHAFWENNLPEKNIKKNSFWRIREIRTVLWKVECGEVKEKNVGGEDDQWTNFLQKM